MGNTVTTGKALMKPELASEIFSKVKGHSALAKLSGGEPIPFAGKEIFTFSLDGEAAIVGEGADKPAGTADSGSVTIVPIKFVYQHRVTDEFLRLSEEKQLPILQQYTEGFAKKIARGMDIASMHGVNPFDGQVSSIVGNNCFEKAVTAQTDYDETAPDDCIDKAVQPITDADGTISGIVMSPKFGAALGAMKTADAHTPMYPDYRFGGNPGSFGGMAADVNSTLSFGTSKIMAIVGDFANCFRWGYAEDITFEVIQFGDPDGLGDLKQKNQVCLRSEAYIGWGILVPDNFAKIVQGDE